MEMISRELRAGLPIELLYADDLSLMAESEESLCDKIVEWKSGLEAKGLKMNTGKMKVVVWKIRWKRKVSGPVVYVSRKLAIIQFCAMVTRNGFINDVVEWKEVCVMQASRSSADAVLSKIIKF